MAGEEQSTLVRDVGAILRIVRALGVVPAPLLWLAAVVVATVYYFLSRIDLVDLLTRWHKATQQGPEWDPEKGTGPISPPMEIPEGGMSVPGPGDRWDRNEP